MTLIPDRAVDGTVHPAAVVFVEMQPRDVYVNIHPMKTDVQFLCAGNVFDAVYQAVRAQMDALDRALVIPEEAAEDRKFTRKKAVKASRRQDRPHQKAASNVIVFPGPKSRGLPEYDPPKAS